MNTEAISNRTLLICGMVAGPVYVSATLMQAFSRAGFDIQQHRFTLLTAGDMGWIHQLNMVMVGVLSMLFAVGVSRVLKVGRGAVWGPRLLILFGAAYLFGGLLKADPVIGLPPGTTAEMLQATWQGMVQNTTRGVSTGVLIAASLVIAGWFANTERLDWAWFYGAAFPAVFLALTGVGLLIGGNPVALAFLMSPWLWVTALALHLYLRDGKRGVGVLGDQRTERRPTT